MKYMAKGAGEDRKSGPGARQAVPGRLGEEPRRHALDVPA
jgi:hypothetical protein